MRFDSHALVRVSLIAVTASTLVACATKPPPAPTATVTAPPAPEARAPAPQPQARAPVTQSPQAALPPPVTRTAPPGVGPGSLQDFVVNVGERVFFDYDQYSIRADARPILDAQASWLARYPTVNVRIEGNADERGTQEYNFALGERRANSVRDYLVSKGIAASRISVVSYGKDRPIDAGDNEQAWQRNRNGHTAIVSGTT